MKKLFPVFLFFASFIFSACSGESSGTISIEGSTAMERVMGALIEGYREIDDTVTVNYSGTGSGAGIEAVLSGVCDIGLSSRTLKDSEIQKGAVAHVVALDCIAVIVNPSNPISDISLSSLAAMFTGEITNWSQIGGKDAPIALYGREAGSGTRDTFEKIVGVGGLCRYTNEYSSTGDIVSGIASNPNGIGYISLSNAGNTVKVLQIGGISCSEDAIRSGAYTLQRPFLLVTCRNKPLSPEAHTFLAYAVSDDVADYITIAGAITP